MIESLVSAAIAVVTGGAIISCRLHSRIMELDKRIDAAFELNTAKCYVAKTDFEKMLDRVEDHK